MENFYWETENEHSNNEETMEEYLNEYLPIEYDIIFHDGTYAEIRSKNTDSIYAVHASGNGDFRSHKIEFEFIR